MARIDRLLTPRELRMTKRMMLVAAVACLVTSPAFAGLGDGSVLVGPGYGPYQYGSGGEFQFTAANDGLLYDSLIGATVLPNGDKQFATFCVEEGEHVYPNTTYSAVINTRSVFSDQPLTPQTAFLYAQFVQRINEQGSYLNGTVYAGANYDLSNRRSAGSAGGLQNAIWWFMNEGGEYNDYARLADWAVNGDNSHSGGGFWQGIGDVRIMNLWVYDHAGESGYQRQDMLVMSSVPAPAALLLGVLGLGLVGWIKRRSA
jgi:hypothetical protein